jgi:hypothetical protein
VAENVNRRFEYGQVPAFRADRRKMKAEAFIASGTVPFQITADAAHTAKPLFSGFVPAHEHADRLAAIPAFIQRAVRFALFDHIRVDAAPLQIRHHFFGKTGGGRISGLSFRFGPGLFACRDEKEGEARIPVTISTASTKPMPRILIR